MIYADSSHFDFVAKFTEKNLNRDFTNTGPGGSPFCEFFINNIIFVLMMDSLRCSMPHPAM